MSTVVNFNPSGGISQGLTRVTLRVVDAISGVEVVTPYNIAYTVDGSAPSIGGNGTTRRAPVLNIPLSAPTTIKAIGQTVDTLTTTPQAAQYYDVRTVFAKLTVPTVDPTVSNYTLQIVNGDLVRSVRGQYGVVYGVDKTKQDVREVLVVENVPNSRPAGDRVLPNWGSALNRFLGQALPSPDTPDGIATDIQTSILNAVTTLKNLQTDTHVPLDEQIDQIVSLLVQAVNPTDYKFSITVQTVAGRQISDTQIIRIVGN
jgi:hypothetical protein